jgi:hypothetical protein
MMHGQLRRVGLAACSAFVALCCAGCSDGFQTVSPAEIRDLEPTEGLEGMLIPLAAPVAEAPEEPAPEVAAPVEVEPPPPPKPTLDPAIVDRALACTATGEDLSQLESACGDHPGCQSTEVGSVETKFAWPEQALTVQEGARDVA